MALLMSLSLRRSRGRFVSPGHWSGIVSSVSVVVSQPAAMI